MIEELTDAGVPVSILLAPLIPGLNDEQIPDILEAAADPGAVGASYGLLRPLAVVEEIFVTGSRTTSQTARRASSGASPTCATEA